jgi:hypothetical protein
MNYEVYQDLKKAVKTQDFYTKYIGLKKMMVMLSWLGNAACIAFAYLHVYNSFFHTVTEPSEKTIYWVAPLTIITLVVLEGMKRVLFSKFTDSLVEREMKWVGSELNLLAAISVGLIATSFYLSLTGAQEYADKGDTVTQNIEENITTYQDSLNTLYNGKITVLEQRNEALFADNATINEKAMAITAAWKRADLMKAIESNNRMIASNEENIKTLKEEKLKEVERYESKVNTKGAATIEQGKSNIVFFVTMSTILEFLILFGVFFRGYFPYKAKKEYDKMIETEPKYKKYEKYNELLNIVFKNGAKVGDNVSTKVDMAKLLKINGVDLYGKELDDTLKIFKHVGIIQKRGAKNIIKCDVDKARTLTKEYLKID